MFAQVRPYVQVAGGVATTKIDRPLKVSHRFVFSIEVNESHPELGFGDWVVWGHGQSMRPQTVPRAFAIALTKRRMPELAWGLGRELDFLSRDFCFVGKQTCRSAKLKEIPAIDCPVRSVCQIKGSSAESHLARPDMNSRWGENCSIHCPKPRQSR